MGKVKYLFNLTFSTTRQPQILAAFTASIGIFTHGIISSWSATAVPSLLRDELFQSITIEQQSWIISFAPLAAFLTAPLAGVCVDHLGRKATMLIQAVVLLVGFLLTTFAISVEMLYVGRLISGIALSASVFAPVVYISDVAERDIRGILNSCGQIMPMLGILFSFTVGSFSKWRWLTFYSALISLVYLVLLTVIPESPRFLLANGRMEDAFASLCWLRGADSYDDVREEITLIQTTLTTSKEQKSSWSRLFGTNVCKPFAISMMLMIFQQTIGWPSVQYYSVTIFQNAGTLIDPHLSTIIIGVILVITVGISSCFIDSTGRRPLLLSSGICSTLPLLTLGLYFYTKPTNSQQLISMEWVPLTLILIFVATYASGWISVPWLVMTEILPNNIVGIASGLASSLHFLFSFIIVKYFNVVAVNWGMQWSFWIFGIFGIIATIFVFFFVPETKLKTLEEIQIYLNEVVDTKKSKLKNSEYNTFE